MKMVPYVAWQVGQCAGAVPEDSNIRCSAHLSGLTCGNKQQTGPKGS